MERCGMCAFHTHVVEGGIQVMDGRDRTLHVEDIST